LIQEVRHFIEQCYGNQAQDAHDELTKVDGIPVRITSEHCWENKYLFALCQREKVFESP
jgi:hypothetical protein